ncbi:MAG: tetratricopeptide repeat protein, partial [Candidatus Eisenbacteria bacterium]
MKGTRFGGALLAVCVACALAVSETARGSEDAAREAVSLFRAGRIDEARALLEARIEAAPDDVEARLAYVEMRTALGEREAVRREYDALALKDPSNPAVRLAQIVVLGRSQAKHDAFAEYLGENPDFARGWEEYGRSLLEGYQVQAAAEALARAIALEPGRARAHLYLGLAHRGKGRFDDEEAAIREAYRLDPGSE